MPIQYAKIRANAIVFDKTSAPALPNALFTDLNGDLQNTDNANIPIKISNPFVKKMKNVTGSTIAINTPIAKLPDGSIAPADADGVGTQEVIGVAIEAILDTNFGLVHLIGPNVAGVLTSLGFAPGDEVYLSDTAGYTNTPATLDAETESVVKLGVADCASNIMSAVATDLIFAAEVITQPG